MKVLLVEDNQRLSDRMTQRLKDSFVVDCAMSGHEGIKMAGENMYDIVLLDLGLPDMSGLEVCRRIRLISNEITILIVTGEDDTFSKIELLNSGADDYVTKPFDPQELRARINALIRRRPRIPISDNIIIEDLEINPSKRTVYRDKKPITLRRKEFDILEYLARNQGRIVTREMIVHHCWPSPSSTWGGSVDVHIKHLRDKMDKPFDYKLIKTVYAVGYIMEPRATEKESSI